jgi:hypothetical protein
MQKGNKIADFRLQIDNRVSIEISICNPTSAVSNHSSVVTVVAVVAIPVVPIPAVVGIGPVVPGVHGPVRVDAHRSGCLRGLGKGKRRGQDQAQKGNTKNTGHDKSPFFFAPFLCSHFGNVEFPDRLRIRNG